MMEAVHFAIILHKAHFYDSDLVLGDQLIDRSDEKFPFGDVIELYTQRFPPSDVRFSFYYHLHIQHTAQQHKALKHLLLRSFNHTSQIDYTLTDNTHTDNTDTHHTSHTDHRDHTHTDHIDYLAGVWDMKRAVRRVGVIEHYLGKDAARDVCLDAARDVTLDVENSKDFNRCLMAVKLFFVCDEFRKGIERLNSLLSANLRMSFHGGDANLISFARICYNFFYFRELSNEIERGIRELGVLLRVSEFFDLCQSQNYLNALKVLDESGVLPNMEDLIHVTREQFDKSLSAEVKKLIDAVFLKTFFCLYNLYRSSSDRDRDHYVQRATYLKSFFDEMCLANNETSADIMTWCRAMGVRV